MAVGTDIDVNRADSGTGFDDVTTGTLDSRFFIFWMDTCFHNVLANRFITQGGGLFKSQFIGQATNVPPEFPLPASWSSEDFLQEDFTFEVSRYSKRASRARIKGFSSPVLSDRWYQHRA